MNANVSIQMPRYKCHKEVWALKIAKIEPLLPDGGTTFWPEDGRYAPVPLAAAYMQKHQPEVGGYYVVYHDGYKSYSPAKAFEEGYTLV